MDKTGGWLKRLQGRWQLDSAKQVGIVLLCFALTGFSVLFLKKPVFALIGIAKGDMVFWQSVLYYVLILPVYFAILLFWGSVFGQSAFFLAFVRRTFSRMAFWRK